MEKQEYIEEVNLIKEQNDTEFEIYPMAVEIIRPTIKNLSKRYVFARRKTDKGQIYYGISSFPDVAILDKKFKNISNKTISEEVWHQLKGCLEVKALETKLITKDQIEEVLSTKPDKLKKEIGQLIGEILWYKKVLYTNGVEWRCLYINEYSEELIKRQIPISLLHSIIFYPKTLFLDCQRAAFRLPFLLTYIYSLSAQFLPHMPLYYSSIQPISSDPAFSVVPSHPVFPPSALPRFPPAL